MSYDYGAVVGRFLKWKEVLIGISLSVADLFSFCLLSMCLIATSIFPYCFCFHVHLGTTWLSMGRAEMFDTRSRCCGTVSANAVLHR